MKISTKILLIALSAALCLSTVSCKKDKKTTTSESFDGSPIFDVPAFVNPGDVIECIPSGISRADDGDWGFYWTTNPMSVRKDTTKREGEKGDGKYTFTVRDTLCDVKVMCVAFAEGYYTASSYKMMTIVRPGFGGSISDDDIDTKTPRIVDSRDGKAYPFAEIGDLQWFSRNLAYEGNAASYENCKAMTDIFGLYYDWDEAQTACPEGWRLPTKSDWDNLAESLGAKAATDDALDYTGIAGDLMVNAYFNGTRLWEYWPNVNITNKARFSALPTGLATKSQQGVTFSNVMNYAAWWTAQECDEEKALYRYINVNQPHVYAGHGYKSSMLLPVRCVREK